ncbi:MerR family transcriptional regulator [Streptacidiphilus sp. ASG 303]|uniref:MerR family transcriptional regulator n=1 Tax=Streptacidiphilus sp. ASG 303 TaxID=2896847 RepID=UPI001E4A36BA|nr:MerR family transcriptional regulator [Streptacidiphilus sp. ASG 303]MCD0484421.1 MerR family transcriptional regulator [Streptacidiphilus sp. ASG 303]
MSSTGDSTAAGGSSPVHPVREDRRQVRRTWEARVSEVPADPSPQDDAHPGPASALVGFRGPTACAAAGITYRQLDYWARTGLVEPSVRPAQGSGSQRLYSFRDILILKIVKRLLDAGVSLQNIRVAVTHLRSRGIADLTGVTLMSDGATVYECTSPHEVVDLLQGGQGVFGIAVGAVWRELEGSLGRLHAERTDTGETLVADDPGDELARRRIRAV